MSKLIIGQIILRLFKCLETLAYFNATFGIETSSVFGCVTQIILGFNLGEFVNISLKNKNRKDFEQQ